jgi:ABC-type dipeptide/oligopeptide/nickel transport system permease component
MTSQTASEISHDAGFGAGRQTALIAGAVIVLALVVAGLVLAISAMVRNPDSTETVRDILIIFVAGESFLIGLALIVLIVQLARLTALLQNEVRPILESTNDTVNTLRGTSQFLSDNVVRPVIKANGSLAAVRRVMDLIRRRV